MPDPPALRSIALASLFAVTAIAAGTLVGPAVATHGPTDRGGEAWDPADESGPSAVGPGAVVFQGESGIDTVAAGNGSAADFRHVDNGTVLELPIPADQPTGTYEAVSNGDTLVVREPRIVDYEFLNEDGADVAGGMISTANVQLLIRAQYNFGTAADLRVCVTDEAGHEWTNESIERSADRVNGTTEVSQWVQFPVDLRALPGMEEYAVELTSARSDVAVGANLSDTFELGSGPHPPRLYVDRQEAGPRERVEFEITYGFEDEHYLVTIDDAHLESNYNPDDVFGSTDRTAAVGSTASYAYALIHIEGGRGIGVLGTEDVGSGDVTVALRGQVSANATVTDEFVENHSTVDRFDLAIEDGQAAPGSESNDETGVETRIGTQTGSETGTATPGPNGTKTPATANDGSGSPGETTEAATPTQTTDATSSTSPTTTATATDGADGPAPGPVGTVLAVLAATVLGGWHRQRR